MNGKSHNNSTKFVLIAFTSLVLLIPLYYPNSLSYSSFLSTTTNNNNSSSSNNTTKYFFNESEATTSTNIPSSSTHKCDIFTGKWVPNPEAPYYTNATCRAIHEHQNCMKYGRPDSDFMKWHWKPERCELPVFDPVRFLELMRDKSLAFVGDSVARNHAQSLICLLAGIENPTDISDPTNMVYLRQWKYTNHNFTMSIFWAPHLVNSSEPGHRPDDPSKLGLFNLYLDEFDENWTIHVAAFDHLILSAGHWFYNPKMFYRNRTLVGCHKCGLANVTDLGMFFGYRMALKTAFKAIDETGFRGVVYFRTFAPSHFEDGAWNEGGGCPRTRPFRGNETALRWLHKEMYETQVEEFRAAERGRRSWRLMDVTMAALLRPDGHPGRYGRWGLGGENVTMHSDCVHWCLPGPIDTWNDFLLHMLITQG